MPQRQQERKQQRDADGSFFCAVLYPSVLGSLRRTCFKTTMNLHRVQCFAAECQGAASLISNRDCMTMKYCSTMEQHLRRLYVNDRHHRTPDCDSL